MKNKFTFVGALVLFGFLAQFPVAAEEETYQTLSPGELEQLVGPIALYPDDLVGIVLPASTYPLQVVQAARYLKDHENDPTLKPNEDWDDTVIALLNYPEVIELLNADVDWTWTLGQAVINQEPELVAAIDGFREQAYRSGNLKSDEHQVVKRNDDGNLVIERVDPEVIYVPRYEPKEVVVYQTRPVYHYHARPYPVYYYPYPVDYYFPSRFFWGVSSYYRWRPYYGLRVHHYGYASHPFFGYNYYTNHYYFRHHHRRFRHRLVDTHSHGRYRNRGYRGDRWRPHGRNVGARPTIVNNQGRQRFRNRGNGDLNRNPGQSLASNNGRGRAPRAGTNNRFRGDANANRNTNRSARNSNRRTDGVYRKPNRVSQNSSDNVSTRFRARTRPSTDNRVTRRNDTADRAQRSPGTSRFTRRSGEAQTRTPTRSNRSGTTTQRQSNATRNRFTQNRQARQTATTRPNARRDNRATTTTQRGTNRSGQSRPRVVTRKPATNNRSTPRATGNRSAPRARQAPRTNRGSANRSTRSSAPRSRPNTSRASRPSGGSNKGSSSRSRGSRESGGGRQRRSR